jgi:hypothetical protein
MRRIGILAREHSPRGTDFYMTHRSSLLLATALILSLPSSGWADGPARKNFGETRFDMPALVEPAAGEEENAASGIAPAAAPMTEEAPSPEPSAALNTPDVMSEPAVISNAATPVPAAARCEPGLAEPSDKSLMAYHSAGPAGILGAGQEFHLDNVQGALSYDGEVYKLRMITLDLREFRPFSGVTFPMKLRFDYANADETHVTVDVPVRDGAVNLGLEKILAPAKGAYVSPDELLPADRSYATMEDCGLVGLPIKRIVLTSPLEISSMQFERLSRL